MAEGPVADLLREQTYQVGLPLDKRRTNADESAYTVTTFNSAFSDSSRTVDGRLDLTYKDRRPYDIPAGSPTETPDDVDLDARFTDPAGNQYRLEIKQVFQPPIPPWNTGGGVVTGSWLHGVTGTGTPLMPTQFAYGACWGVGNVIVNGEVVNRRQVIHFMTTQMIRKAGNYALAIDEELPLSPDEAYLGNLHHTHVLVPPIKVTQRGPEPEPVHTAFELPTGRPQPFLHVMWDEETIEGATVAVSPDFPDAATTTQAAETTTATTTQAGTTQAVAPDADFVLGGRVGGWRGISPDSIDGETNPTLNLQPGTEYTLVWKNLDGAPHNFAIVGEQGSTLLSTEVISEQGATQTVEFTAESAMAEYLCEVHPISMRGDIAFPSG
ncbi:hypothetical protein M0R89_18250 [Halorussus limi]|uniref:Blue (type 1) copper domain-containing protein n=1 Tax=Halorussus limi TaxID=2938695 RepID=A0A8U0HUD8_9EURY|nr:hypothetical protein [Halorussus limi]UPV74459.1 hypothetical protein M0R89_18250 [Halorussus limi]